MAHPKNFVLFDFPNGPILVNPSHISSCEYLGQDKTLKVYFGSSNEPRITLSGETAYATFKAFAATLAEPAKQE